MVQCYLLVWMCKELQRQHEDIEPRAMLVHLIELFSEHSRTQRYDRLKSLFRVQMDDLSLV